MFYPSGPANDVISYFLLCAINLEEELLKIRELWLDSRHKFPESWWIRKLNPIMERSVLYTMLPKLSQVLKIAMLDELDKMELDNSKMLQRITKHETLFEELREWIYQWSCEKI